MLSEEQNKSNLVYFEGSSIRELYDRMKTWQTTNQKLFLSLSIHQDKENFCCIALFYPRRLVRHDPYDPVEKLYEEDMMRYQRKALKRIGVSVSFESTVIPREKILAIQSKLEKCTTPTQVKAVFDEEF